MELLKVTGSSFAIRRPQTPDRERPTTIPHLPKQGLPCLGSGMGIRASHTSTQHSTNAGENSFSSRSD